MNDPRVFQLTRSRVTPPPTAEAEARQEAFDEAILIARLYEERGANAGAVRLALEARAQTTETERGEFGVVKGALYDERPFSASVTPRSASVVTPLDEAPQPGGLRGASSSGATGTDGQPSTPLSEGEAPLTYDDWLGHIIRMYDEVLRALGTPEPQSRKAFPRLRRVK